ncbi:unnamed protein product [Didymodactylos carnosus]|uniref:Uncharacterized protein n=1 Tax=Didymodactylos carnosus TaxID=1234261 RepID=A0A814K766_9BILA|nr:unnamed protein product [Didymodactylos carnosus]CAF3815403.1 unnamed protein product [Didymodactylos carnosus]
MEHHYTTTVRDAWGLCLLTFQNLMRIHRRIQPVTDGGARNALQIKVKQRDRQLISMLLAEVQIFHADYEFNIDIDMSVAFSNVVSIPKRKDRPVIKKTIHNTRKVEQKQKKTFYCSDSQSNDVRKQEHEDDEEQKESISYVVQENK